MTLRGVLGILLSRWYVVIVGVLLSVLLAGFVCALVPVQYTSSGVAVLLQPRRTDRGANSNALLDFDSSLSTTALIIVQDLNTSQTAALLGLRSGTESYTIQQASADDSGASGQVVQPFISAKSKAATAERSLEIIDGLFGQARDDLIGQQKDLRVLPKDYIRLQELGYTSTPQRVMTTVAAATGAALLIGLCLTFASALLLDLRERRRTARRRARAPSARMVPDPRLVFSTEEFVVGVDADAVVSNGTHGLASRMHG